MPMRRALVLFICCYTQPTQAPANLFFSIEAFYNRQWRYSTLGYVRPGACEAYHYQQQRQLALIAGVYFLGRVILTLFNSSQKHARLLAEDIRNKRILILGGSGFIGSHLTAKLRGEMALDVVVHRGHQDCDLTNTKSTFAYITNIKPDIIFHLAAMPDTETKQVFTNNITMTKNVLSSLPLKEHILLIHAGSYKQYGFMPIPFNESMLPAPYNYYSWSKVVSELLIQKRAKTHSCLTTILLRLGPVIGEGQSKNTLIATVVDAIVRNRGNSLKIADIAWDPTPVADVVEALITCLFCEPDITATINISSGISRTPLFVAQEVARLMGQEINPVVITKGMRPCLGATNKAHHILGWRAAQDFCKALETTLHYFLDSY